MSQPAILPSLEQVLLQQQANMQPQPQPPPQLQPSQPLPQESDPHSNWDGDWWKEAEWGGWDWNQHVGWHQPPPTPPTPAFKGAGKGAPPPQEPDPLQASLQAEIDAQHEDPNHWTVNLPFAFEEDFGDLRIYFDDSAIEIWRGEDGHSTFVASHVLTVVAYLRGYSAKERHGAPRGLAEVLDQDSVAIVDVPSSHYHGYTFEQVAQQWPGEMDDLIDTMENSDMLCTQIALRLYGTLRRQLLTLLRRILDMNQTD